MSIPGFIHKTSESASGLLTVSFYYEYIITCLNKPLYFVFENHNLCGRTECRR